MQPMSDRRLPHIALRCLGTFDVTMDAAVVTAFPTDKLRALFTYLALEARPQRREVLAGLLWPEMTDDAALANLRLAVHRLRKTLDSVAPGAGEAILQSTRQTVQLNHSVLA